MLFFAEFITEKNEKICMNLSCIVLVVPTKRGILIQTSDGDTFNCINSYSDFIDLITSEEFNIGKNVEIVEKSVNINKSIVNKQ